MNKAKQLQKKIGVSAVVILVLLIVSAGAMAVTGMMAGKAVQRKTDAETARNNDSSQISTMRNQIEQSGDAEKRFLEIALKHSSNDYSANTDALKEWLRAMKEQYRFTDTFKLTLALDKPSDKPEFSALDFDVTVREPMKLEFGAISDMHVFSFVNQLEHDMPGLVRVTRLTMERRMDMNAASYRELATGLNPEYVNASVEFTWVGLAPKAEAADANGAPAAPAPGGV